MLTLDPLQEKMPWLMLCLVLGHKPKVKEYRKRIYILNITFFNVHDFVHTCWFNIRINEILLTLLKYWKIMQFYRKHQSVFWSSVNSICQRFRHLTLFIFHLWINLNVLFVIKDVWLGWKNCLDLNSCQDLMWGLRKWDLNRNGWAKMGFASYGKCTLGKSYIRPIFFNF